MDVSTFPTKGNLIKARASLELSIQGYELLDKKRNILINEMLSLISRAEKIQADIDKVFSTAYKALQRANISLGISTLQQVGYAIPEEDGIEFKSKSIMGVEIPIVKLRKQEGIKVNYSFFRTNYFLDIAYENFNKAKMLCLEIAEVENTIYRLAEHIKKTQKRANALKSIIIPKYRDLVNKIQNSLEEKEREEFSRLHVLKEKKGYK
ncbi:MAG TPA: V-type ATP synthase subunit D [Clostridiaceae bacterium]|nr:V-type ATP synthase subunit D [Clostridiaceae bacterium]